jgi:hypothetical protein
VLLGSIYLLINLAPKFGRDLRCHIGECTRVELIKRLDWIRTASLSAFVEDNFVFFPKALIAQSGTERVGVLEAYRGIVA